MTTPERKPRSVWFSDEEWADAQAKAEARDDSVSSLFRKYIKNLHPKKK